MDEQTTTSSPKSGGFNPLIIVGVVIILAVAGIGIWMTKGSSMTQMSAQPTTAPQVTAAVSPSEAMQADTASKTVAFTVNGGEFYFKPNEIKVKKGDTVKITFKNDGGFHDFVIDELNVNSGKIGSGESKTFQFVADKAGSFEYYCSVGKHREMVSKGTLIVE